MHYLDYEHNGNGHFVLEGLANKVRQKKTDSKKDISLRVREFLISEIYAKYHSKLDS